MSIENNVQLTGNLGDDPKVSYTQGGMTIARISLATTSRRKNKEGDKVEETQWHRVVFFGKLADIVGDHLRRGSKIKVDGMIRYGKYNDKEGVTRYTAEIAADSMLMLDTRPEQDRGNTSSSGPRGGAPARERPAKASDFGDDFADDDIPFATNRGIW